MCPFKYLPIHKLFRFICDHHKANGTEPDRWYSVLRNIIADRTILTGKNRMRAMMHNLRDLRVEYPNHDDFFDWFHQLYRSHHPKKVTVTTQPANVAAAEVAKHEDAETVALEERENHTVVSLAEDGHSINIKDVKDSIEKTIAHESQPKPRRRWWLLFMA